MIAGPKVVEMLIMYEDGSEVQKCSTPKFQFIFFSDHTKIARYEKYNWLIQKMLT